MISFEAYVDEMVKIAKVEGLIGRGFTAPWQSIQKAFGPLKYKKKKLIHPWEHRAARMVGPAAYGYLGLKTVKGITD